MLRGREAANLCRRFVARNPKSSLTSIGISGSISYAYYIENQAKSRECEHLKDPSVIANTLPRKYDWDTINAYWSERPLTTATRFCTILYEILPVWMYYVKDFHLLPYLRKDEKNISSTNNNNEKNNDHLEMEIEHASRLREVLTELGPAFVKAGQQISVRPDLVSPSVLKELQKLCDEVKPVSDTVAHEMIKKELGIDHLTELFDEINLVASASLGQVYKATLKESGDTVAVKIQRPGMLQSFSLDLFLLQKVAALSDTVLTALTHQLPFHKNLFHSFARGSYSELDYENEAKNQIKFKTELEKRNCDVLIPSVYQEHSTTKVLTTQWINGIRLSDAPKETIQQLIPIGVELFLTQLLDLGSFHADPHPGNLLVTTCEKSGKKQLCLLDFGLCADIEKKDCDAITRAIVHLLVRDFDTLISKDAKDLGFLPMEYNTDELKPLLKNILTIGVLEDRTSNLKQRKRKLMEISNDLNEVFFMYPFSVPPFFALITRGLGILEGIALTGDPNFDIFGAAIPYARRRAVGVLGAHSLRKLRNYKTSTL